MQSVMTQRKHAASVGHEETEDDLSSVRKHMTSNAGLPSLRQRIDFRTIV